MPKIDVSRFRFYGLRHGAAFNFKHADVPPHKAAPYLCMSVHVYETIYGLEEGELLTVDKGTDLLSLV